MGNVVEGIGRRQNGGKIPASRKISALCRLAAWLCVAVLIQGGEASAQSEAPIDPAKLAEIRAENAKCFACHSPEGAKAPPRSDLDHEKLKTLVHPVDVFNASNHGRVECRACHGAAATTFPHPPNLRAQVSTCAECHASKVFRIETQFEKSVHARRLKELFTCSSCHDGHAFKVAAKIGNPRQIVSQDNAMCLDCHDRDARFGEFAPVDKRRPNIDTIHAWLPNTRLHWQAVRCVECHTPAGRAFSHEILDRSQAERNCVSCHTQESSLRTRLYRHLVAEEQEQFGFVNSVILSNSYVVGATRNRWIDGAVLWLLAATVAGVMGHGLLRLVLAAWRRRRP